MQKIGVLGGTFDPIHNGHLAIAEEVRWQLKLDQIWFVPAGQQPLKPDGHSASPADRLAMTELATARNPAFRVSDLEVNRAGPSYTIDTMAFFRSQYPTSEFWFIVGADVLATLHRWREIERLVQLCRFVALGRPGVALDTAELAHLPVGLQWEYIAGPALDISATTIRQRCQQGAPIRYQVPEPVFDYILSHQLYGVAPHA